MKLRYEAAWEIHQFLTKRGLAYAIIGGLAVQKWSDPRFTRDVDLAVAAPLTTGSAPLVRLITEHFPSRSADPVDFAAKTRMVLITASNGVEVDISLALPGYEDQLFARAVDYEIEPSKAIRLCSAEDLIIHKCVAGRRRTSVTFKALLNGRARNWSRPTSVPHGHTGSTQSTSRCARARTRHTARAFDTVACR